jgi:hypothetical protein
MAGSVLFGVAIVVVGVLVLIAGVTPLLLVPVVVIGVAVLALSPLLARLRGSAIAQPGAGPRGVPTTRDAAYEPVEDPAQRRTP